MGNVTIMLIGFLDGPFHIDLGGTSSEDYSKGELSISIFAHSSLSNSHVTSKSLVDPYFYSDNPTSPYYSSNPSSIAP